MIRLERIRDLLHKFSGKRILVVGDLMLDRYVTGSVSRISPEAPVPVVLVNHEYARPGGAANVALNVRSLGGEALAAGIAGRDVPGNELIRLLGEAGIGTGGILVTDRVQTTVKTRVMAGRQQIVRVDREDARERAERAAVEMEPVLQRVLNHVDGVIVEDYSKGVITQVAIDCIMRDCRARGIPVALDPKDNDGLTIRGLRLATPNYAEARLAAGLPMRRLPENPLEDGELDRIAEILMARWETELLLITLGPHGMYSVGAGGRTQVIPTRAREVFDVSGAGDTVIATALLSLVAGASDDEAASLANFAAGVVVGKLGTATCSQDELVDCMTRDHNGKGGPSA
ncbi:MAG: hypothetical protein A2498_00690 [Lentisphaerae bacterium RIFOXYC12_FULL_60_16]|nr:MAG: hypothetical protein A2498_00690 [Lentisphaerae bacterium RIFOXYC12_FULL_60_16]OGV84369.1 MAG: hypothetical protein A2340_03895 [Lentisphaerae bacterium RIFOXYB12_FULL_60_10]